MRSLAFCAFFELLSAARVALSLAVGWRATKRQKTMDEFVIRGGALVQEQPNIWDFLVPRLLDHKELIAQVSDT
jgi:hypothetical protein